MSATIDEGAVADRTAGLPVPMRPRRRAVPAGPGVGPSTGWPAMSTTPGRTGLDDARSSRQGLGGLRGSSASPGGASRDLTLAGWARRLRNRHRHRALERNTEWILQARRTPTLREQDAG